MSTKRSSARIDAELGADDAAHGRGVAGDLVARGFLAERLEMRLHRRHLRNRSLDRSLDLLGDRVRLLEREVARELEVERELGAAVDRDDRDVVHLAHARDVERRGVRALAHVGIGGSAGSTWTTTSASGSADCTARSTASAAAWPWGTAAS